MAAFFAVCIAGSCIEKEKLVADDRTRTEAESGEARYEPPEGTAEAGPDTVLYVCGVEPSGGYDWIRDTLAGAYDAKIVLFEATGKPRKWAEFRRVLEIPAGPRSRISPEPDMVHLLGGHVYTEYSDARSTSLGRDGKELLRFDGRACLRGLLEGSDGFLYSLWMDRSGTGICLRKGEEILFTRSDAVPFGGFNGPDCLRSGALYERDGAACCSWFSDIGGGRTYFVARCQEQTQVFLPESYDTVEDLKIAGGMVCAAGRKDGALRACIGAESFLIAGRRTFPWNDVHILELDGKAFVAGRTSNARGTPEMALWSSGEDGARTSRKLGTFLLHDGLETAAVKTPDGCFFAVPGGGCVCGSRHVLALTPLRGGGRPFVRTESEDTEIALKGFLTGAEYVIKY